MAAHLSLVPHFFFRTTTKYNTLPQCGKQCRPEEKFSILELILSTIFVTAT